MLITMIGRVGTMGVRGWHQVLYHQFNKKGTYCWWNLIFNGTACRFSLLTAWPASEMWICTKLHAIFVGRTGYIRCNKAIILVGTSTAWILQLLPSSRVFLSASFFDYYRWPRVRAEEAEAIVGECERHVFCKWLAYPFPPTLPGHGLRL